MKIMMSGKRFYNEYKAGGTRDMYYKNRYGNKTPLDKNGQPTLGWLTYQKNMGMMPLDKNLSASFKINNGEITVYLTNDIANTTAIDFDDVVYNVGLVVKEQEEKEKHQKKWLKTKKLEQKRLKEAKREYWQEKEKGGICHPHTQND